MTLDEPQTPAATPIDTRNVEVRTPDGQVDPVQTVIAQMKLAAVQKAASESVPPPPAGNPPVEPKQPAQGGNQVLPKPSEPTPIKPAQSTSDDNASKPAQDATIPPAPLASQISQPINASEEHFAAGFGARGTAMPQEQVAESIRKFIGTEQLPSGIHVINDVSAPWAAKIADRNRITVNAAQISSPERAGQAILEEGFHGVWDQPELQPAWRAVLDSITPDEMATEYAKRKAQGLPTDSDTIREEAAISKMVQGDTNRGIWQRLFDGARAAFKRTFGIELPGSYRQRLKVAALEFLRNRDNWEGAKGDVRNFNGTAAQKPEPRLLDVRRSNAEILTSAANEIKAWPERISAPDGSDILLTNPERGSLGQRTKHLVWDNRDRLDPQKAQWISSVPDTLANAQARLRDPESGNRIYVREYRDGTRHMVVVRPDGVVDAQKPFTGNLITQFPSGKGPGRQSSFDVEWRNDENGYRQSQGTPAPTPKGSQRLDASQSAFQQKLNIEGKNVKYAAGESAPKIFPGQPAEKPISQKIDDLATALSEIKNSLSASQDLSKPLEPPPVKTSDNTSAEQTSKPAQDATVPPAPVASNQPAFNLSGESNLTPNQIQQKIKEAINEKHEARQTLYPNRDPGWLADIRRRAESTLGEVTHVLRLVFGQTEIDRDFAQTEQGRRLQTVANAYGSHVVFYKSDSPAPNGFEINGLTFVRTGRPEEQITQSFEHELAHALANDPRLTRLRSAVDLNSPAAAHLRFLYDTSRVRSGHLTLSDDKVREEVVTHFIAGQKPRGIDPSEAFQNPTEALSLALEYHGARPMEQGLPSGADPQFEIGEPGRLRSPQFGPTTGTVQPSLAAPAGRTGLREKVRAFPTGKVQIQSPRGDLLYIPQERLQSALRAGYTLAPMGQGESGPAPYPPKPKSQTP